MRKSLKAALLAVLGLASVTATMAGVSYNGDLMVGFTIGSGYDLVYDIGSQSSITNGQTWNLSSALTGAGLNSSLSTVQWGVVGSGTLGNHNVHVWTTSASGAGPVDSGTFNNIRPAVASLMANDFTTAGLGNYGITNYGLTFSWYSETAQTVANGLSGTAFAAIDLNPNRTGLGAIAFYDQNTGIVTVQQLGNFTLNSSGVLTYNTLSVSASTNAYLTSLVLNPAGLTSTFVSNTFSYLATNAYGSTPNVTVVNADLTATNQLFTNGVAVGQLTSGSASVGIPLKLGTTNVIQVLVTAAAGAPYTNLYTVNLVEQPSQTRPTLTNSVSGGTNLVLSWPADHLGYRLLVQTNNLAKGVSSNTNDWGTVVGSQSITATNLPIIKAGVTNEFYRLAYP